MKKIIMAIVLIALTFSIKAQNVSNKPVPDKDAVFKDFEPIKTLVNEITKYEIVTKNSDWALSFDQDAVTFRLLLDKFFKELASFNKKYENYYLPWCEMWCAAAQVQCNQQCYNYPLTPQEQQTCLYSCYRSSVACVSMNCSVIPNVNK